jgi:probable rRNA maturation factor
MSRPATGHGTKSGVMSLAIHLVGELEILRLNEAFLGHRGPTDVITFGYGSDSDFGVPFLPAGFDDAGWTSDSGPSQIGEIFICTKIAREQAKRYQTSWQNELVRYLVHGLLHLCGHDDQKATARRHMKRDENRLLRRLARQFDFSQISKP